MTTVLTVGVFASWAGVGVYAAARHGRTWLASLREEWRR